MYKEKSPQLNIEDFILPFGGKLRADNRWVKLSAIIPWDAFEERYAKQFGKTGNPAKTARVALGALIIQTKMKWTDEETVEQIRENHYMQYFLGMREYRDEPLFEASSMLYAQQKKMYDERTHSVEHRIVSLSQPHVRPIVRGKARADVEFGAKLTVSLVKGHATIERLTWESYNESGDLPAAIEAYRERYGVFPEAVLADRIFSTRANRAYCTERGIRLSGPPLGRPKLTPSFLERTQAYRDAGERNAIEGCFGVAKRRYGLDCIMAKLKDTSETAIYLHFLVMNLERRIRLFLALWLSWAWNTGWVRWGLLVA